MSVLELTIGRGGGGWVKPVRTPHRCTACGRRTYRKRRTIPVVDERCQKCFERGYFPKRTKEGDRP